MGWNVSPHVSVTLDQETLEQVEAVARGRFDGNRSAAVRYIILRAIETAVIDAAPYEKLGPLEVEDDDRG